MGMYLETAGRFDKARVLAATMEGEIVPRPAAFNPPEGKTLVCVVENAMFEAAGICYDEREFMVFNEDRDDRPRSWLLVPTAAAAAQNKEYAQFLKEGDAPYEARG